METPEYRLMYEIETRYWWFRNLHDMLSDLIRAQATPELLAAGVLDAGCGTGGLVLRLRELSEAVQGFDISQEAARFWEERGLRGAACIASINEIPYADDTFGVTVSADILECEGVEDRQAYAELVRVTRPNGLIVVVVPAYQWMMTAGHHQAVHAVRRYNKASLRALSDGLPVRVERLTHGFAAVFPMVGGTRLYHRWQERRGSVEVKSELQALPPLINEALYRLTDAERHLLRHVDMPFGSSLIMLARKLA